MIYLSKYIVYRWYDVPSWVAPNVLTSKDIWESRLFEKEDKDCVYDKSLGTGSSEQTKFHILDAILLSVLFFVSKNLLNSSSPLFFLFPGEEEADGSGTAGVTNSCVMACNEDEEGII